MISSLGRRNKSAWDQTKWIVGSLLTRGSPESTCGSATAGQLRKMKYTHTHIKALGATEVAPVLAKKVWLDGPGTGPTAPRAGSDGDVMEGVRTRALSHG